MLSVSQKCCVTSLLTHIVQELLIHCGPQGTLLWITSLPSPAGKGTLRVFSAWKCPGISFVWLVESLWVSGGVREGGKLVELTSSGRAARPGRSEQSMGITLLPPFSEGQLYRKSALCAFSCALSRRNPKEGSASGHCCHGGSLPGDEGVSGVAASRVLLGYFLQTASVVSLRAEVAKVEGKWIYCPDGPCAAGNRSVTGLPWCFDSSVKLMHS